MIDILIALLCSAVAVAIASTVLFPSEPAPSVRLRVPPGEREPSRWAVSPRGDLVCRPAAIPDAPDA